MKVRDRKGFTLIELMIVLAIIAILVAIVVPRLGKKINLNHSESGIGSERSLSSSGDCNCDCSRCCR